MDIQQLLLMTAGCLLNTTQTSSSITHLFRQCEGITTILSLLRNEFILASAMTTLTPVDSTPRFTSLSALSEKSSGSFASVGSFGERVAGGETNSKKVLTYLVGILMNICKLDSICCREIVQFRGVEVLVELIQLTQERLAIFCIECLKTCCKHNEESKVRLEK